MRVISDTFLTLKKSVSKESVENLFKNIFNDDSGHQNLPISIHFNSYYEVFKFIRN